MRQSLKSSTGFTLIELGMVLVVISLIVGPIFSYLTVSRDKENLQVTIDKQKKIAIAISNYVQKNGYLPCPAGSFTVTQTSPWWQLIYGTQRDSCHAAVGSRYGIVPFRDLGLVESDVIDGYGNPFTYAVSPAANNIPDMNPTITGSPVAIYPDCTGTKWAGEHPKKYFCCRQAALSEQVEVLTFPDPLDTGATPITPVRDIQGLHGYSPTGLGAAVPKGQSLRYFAYVLVSHGKNGEGSYIMRRTGRKPWRIAGTREQENGASSTVFYDLPINTKSGNDYFDDIVLWRTQDQVMAETGNNSCMNP